VKQHGSLYIQAGNGEAQVMTSPGPRPAERGTGILPVEPRGLSCLIYRTPGLRRLVAQSRLDALLAVNSQTLLPAQVVAVVPVGGVSWQGNLGKERLPAFHAHCIQFLSTRTEGLRESDH
jgi:hypothetical protein